MAGQVEAPHLMPLMALVNVRVPIMAELDVEYRFGLGPHYYLTTRQYTHVLALRGLVQDALQLPTTPKHLRPLVEDLSSDDPYWVRAKQSSITNSSVGW